MGLVAEEKKSEASYLFPKTYSCPVCDKQFKTLAVRAGKVRNIGQDQDLRPLFREVDSLKYDAVVCPHCGYAALARYFDNLMPTQKKKIQHEVEETFHGMEMNEEQYSYDEAIMRYKMALKCDKVGEVKNSRKAYTCLKLAWVLRGKLEHEGKDMLQEERELLYADEMEYIQSAYNGYKLAFSSEHFPMSGMDEDTLSYLSAELAYELGQYREALQYIAKIFAKKSISSRLRDKALDLKERIRAKVKSEN